MPNQLWPESLDAFDRKFHYWPAHLEEVGQASKRAQ
jgi:hypothetical protein